MTLVLAAFSIGVALFDELTWSVTNKLQFKAWPETAVVARGALARERRAADACLRGGGWAVAVLSGRGATRTRRLMPPFKPVQRGRKGAE